MEIRINTDEVRNIGSQLRNISNECEEMQSGLGKIKTELDACWDGAASSGAIDTIERVEKGFRELVSGFGYVSSEVINIAEAFEAVDHGEGVATARIPIADFKPNRALIILGPFFKMAKTIRIEPDAVRKCAMEIEDIGNRLEQSVTAISNCSEHLRAVWVGASVDKTVEGLEELGSGLKSLADVILEFCNQVRVMADRYEEVDSSF